MMGPSGNISLRPVGRNMPLIFRAHKQSYSYYPLKDHLSLFSTFNDKSPCRRLLERKRYQWCGGKSAPEQYLGREITFQSSPRATKRKLKKKVAKRREVPPKQHMAEKRVRHSWWMIWANWTCVHRHLEIPSTFLSGHVKYIKYLWKFLRVLNLTKRCLQFHHISFCVSLCVHDTTEMLDGVAELPGTQMSLQTYVNWTYLLIILESHIVLL